MGPLWVGVAHKVGGCDRGLAPPPLGVPGPAQPLPVTSALSGTRTDGTSTREVFEGQGFRNHCIRYKKRSSPRCEHGPVIKWPSVVHTAHTCTLSHTRMCAHSHPRIHTPHTHTLTHTLTCAHSPAHPRVHSHPSCAQTPMHTSFYAHPHACMLTPHHAGKHTPTHTLLARTLTYPRVCTLRWACRAGPVMCGVPLAYVWPCVRAEWLERAGHPQCS